MNIGEYAKRAIIAIIICVLLVILFSKLVTAFIPGTFTAGQIELIDWLIYVIGFCYVVWGGSWFVKN